MTLDGKVATRDRRLEVDLRRARAARSAHRWRAELRRGRRRDRHRARRRPAAHRAHRRRRRASRAASSSTPPRACRWTRKLVQRRAEVPLTVVVSRAAPRTRDRRARDRRRRRDRRHRGATSPRVALGAGPARRRAAMTSILLEGGPHLAGAFFDAGEIDEVRLFLAPSCSAAAPPATRSRARASRRSPRRCAALTLDCERSRRRRARLRPPRGVVNPCSPGSCRTWAPSTAVDTTATACASPCARASAPSSATGDSVAVNGVCLTAVGICGERFAADVMHETLRRSSLGDAGARARRQPRAAAARRPTASAATSCRATSTASATSRRSARTASRGAWRSRPAPDLLRYVVEKGSIAVDGVSLTVAAVRDTFAVVADPRDPGAHEPGRCRPRATPSTWRWTCSPSTSRSWSWSRA